ncbi:UNVERIFIED_CONTAM: hypothetical protein Slati_3695200 [Sesamum latifolium]|uniref:Uncharacterized protein n=1 Tax=Sesamum latifolium TaxID=2727402 RepID=A0AAW2U167_9LAMI
MKNYIQELGVVPNIAEPLVIFCDNNGTIAQVKEPRSHHRSKHILRRYHLLREMVSRGDCRMDRVISAENTADPLTKPMSQIAHTQHLDKMCLRSMGLGLKRSKSRTSRMGIESPVETCTKSRIHWMSASFHRQQTWVVYAILVVGLTRCQPDWTDSRGSSYGNLGGLVVRVCSEDGEFQEEDPSPVITWQWMGTDAHFHALDQGRETRRRSIGWTRQPARRSRAQHPASWQGRRPRARWVRAHQLASSRSRASRVAGHELASSLASQIAGRELAGCELARPRASLIADRELAPCELAWSRTGLVAGCELARRDAGGELEQAHSQEVEQAHSQEVEQARSNVEQWAGRRMVMRSTSRAARNSSGGPEAAQEVVAAADLIWVR